MDISQLKLLAGRVRDLLQQSSCLVGHSQALDLIAALPGLRDWPEVVAFPERVAVCEVNTTSSSRLAYRIKKKFSLEVGSKQLLELLANARGGASAPRSLLQVWPSGPMSGVYVTTSQLAINALLQSYEDATDGGLVYAEQAASEWEGSIDLGEYGLWSSGIDRLPSGTLLVVGPVRLDQSVWNDSAGRLEMACLHALNSEHRVAVLIDTPTPDRLCEDVDLMVRSARGAESDICSVLRGVVSEDGELRTREPFVRGYPKPVVIQAPADMDAIPKLALEPLRRELSTCKSGMVLFAASKITEHTAYEQLSTALALTEQAGPAARIMLRHRGTPAKDWMVPDPIKQLPFLPSIESAYAQGYRRMLIDSHYLDGDAWLGYKDVLFIGATYGHDVSDVARQLLVRGSSHDTEAFQKIVAVLGLLQIEGENGPAVASDLFLRGGEEIGAPADWDELDGFLRSRRVICWEDELSSLLNSGEVTMGGVEAARSRSSHMTEFLARIEST